MAIKKLNDLETNAKFGRRLFLLGVDLGMYGPAAIARELCRNDECYKLIQPKRRKEVCDYNEDDGFELVARTVQRHFRLETATGVSGNYMLAYGILFDCSLDYLYGRTDVKSCDLEVREICDKLHITETVAKNLIEGYYPNPEVDSPTCFWSEVLSDEIFHTVPQQWLFYCMEVLKFEDLAKKIEAIRRAESVANDSIYKTTLEVRRKSLEKLQPRISSDCEGAFGMLSQTLAKFIDSRMRNWVASRHTGFVDSYYDNEIKKMNLLEDVLKEGAPLEKNNRVEGG